VFGKQSRYHVTITIDSNTFETSLGAKAGQYFVPFNKDMQQKTGLSAADKITIELSLTAQADVKDEVPEDLKAALAKNKTVAQFLIPSLPSIGIPMSNGSHLLNRKPHAQKE
jgi:hypothetical protein